MNLRKLEAQDAPFMLEWMHDENVTKNLRADFASKTLADAEAFIRSSWEDQENIHLAIVSDTNEYMGTVSLKHVSDGTAEFAITTRRSAMGRGYSAYAMHEIMVRAFREYGLSIVYWCVDRSNARAVRFYDKNLYKEMTEPPASAVARYADMPNLKWYAVYSEDIAKLPESVANCKVVRIRTVPTENKGCLSFFEAQRDIPFEIRRIYYISNVPEGERRGFHAHKELKQLLFCPYGRIQLVLENRWGRQEIELSDPSVGVLIEEVTWREMVWLQKDSVLCVAASDYYLTEDYIRDYDAFKKYLGEVQ